MIKINGKEYNDLEIDFNMVCELNAMGVDVFKYNRSPLSALRAYFAICAGLDEQTAGEELEAHILSGGDISELSGAFVKHLTESGFFKAMTAKAEMAAQKSSKAKADADEAKAE